MPILSGTYIKINRISVFNCHLSPHWRQMAIKNTVSIDFDPCLSIVDNVFDCRLPGVRPIVSNFSPFLFPQEICCCKTNTSKQTFKT